MSCSNPPAEEGEALMPRRQKLDKSICGRCRAAKALYAVRITTYCKACFLDSVLQRFIRGLYIALNSAAGPADAPRSSNKKYPGGRPKLQDGQVVIALSGGAGSMAMLDNLLAAEHIGKGDGKRADKTRGEKDAIWDRGTVVYVEFAGVTGMQDKRDDMERRVQRKGLAFIGVRAEEVFDDALAEKFGGSRHRGGLAVDLAHADLQFARPSSSTPTDNLTKLRTLLSALPAASRPAILSNILHAILNLAARTLPNVSHLLIGETSTREAQRVISGAAAGRGWSIPLELQPALLMHESDDKLYRLKPIKELAVKEVAIYCHLKGIESMNERRWAGDREAGKGKGKAPSLEMLTEHFIAGLSVTHPSTVSTIIKTGDKLVFPGDPSGEACPMCQLPVDASAQAWKQRTALTRLDKTPLESLPSDAVATTGLAELLCYACLTTFTPTTHTKTAAIEPVELPHWVGEGLMQSSKVVEQEEMRKEIEAFLL